MDDASDDDNCICTIFMNIIPAYLSDGSLDRYAFLRFVKFRI